MCVLCTRYTFHTIAPVVHQYEVNRHNGQGGWNALFCQQLYPLHRVEDLHVAFACCFVRDYSHDFMSCHQTLRVLLFCPADVLCLQFATIELRRREIDKHRQAQKKREHSQEEAEKDAIRKTVEGEKAWAETER